jgi:hypothetical protein
VFPRAVCVNDATVALVDTVAMRTRRSGLNDEPEYPGTLSLGSWSWRWTGSVLATDRVPSAARKPV